MKASAIGGALAARASHYLQQKSLRFLIAGGINTAVGLAFYPVLLWLVPYFRQHYMAALLIAQAFCLCFAFSTYKLLVFRTRGNIVAEFARFCSFYLMNYVVNWAALPFMVEVLHIHPIVAQLIFAGVIIVTSFFWHNKITFRER